MSKRKEKLRAGIESFVRQYGRKAQRGQEPNDRGYSRAMEAKLKRTNPEELDELLNGEPEDFAPPPPADSGHGDVGRESGQKQSSSLHQKVRRSVQKLVPAKINGGRRLSRPPAKPGVRFRPQIIRRTKAA